MHGFSSHTFSLINAKANATIASGTSLLFRASEPDCGARAELAGTDPDYATRDLHDAIERGDFPKWRVSLQIMPEAEAATYHIHPFDLTRFGRTKTTRSSKSA